jgi:hypothetical protein
VETPDEEEEGGFGGSLAVPLLPCADDPFEEVDDWGGGPDDDDAKCDEASRSSITRNRCPCHS